MLQAAQRGLVMATAEMGAFSALCLLLIGVALAKKPDP